MRRIALLCPVAVALVLSLSSCNAPVQGISVSAPQSVADKENTVIVQGTPEAQRSENDKAFRLASRPSDQIGGPEPILYEDGAEIVVDMQDKRTFYADAENVRGTHAALNGEPWDMQSNPQPLMAEEGATQLVVTVWYEGEEIGYVHTYQLVRPQE